MGTDEVFAKAKVGFAKALDRMKEEFKHMQIGRAHPALVENVMVEAYGGLQPLKAVANIALLDQKTLSIQPWDRSLMAAIEKGILKNVTNLSPMNNGVLIMLKMPPITEERRAEVAKQVRSLAEEAKIVVRGARQDAISAFKKMKDDKEIGEDELFRSEKTLQASVDEANKQIVDTAEAKEKDVMTV